MNGHKIICGSLAGACVAGAAGLLLAERDQVGQAANMFFAGVCMLLAFVFVWMGWWDEAVNDSVKPSLAEGTVATGWLWLRRVVCWAGAFISLLIAASMLAKGIQPGQGLAVLLALGVGGMLIWAGLKGLGRLRGMSDDAAVHAERRKRYGWWF